MSDDSAGFAPPPFKPDEALQRARRELRGLGLTEREGRFVIEAGVVAVILDAEFLHLEPRRSRRELVDERRDRVGLRFHRRGRPGGWLLRHREGSDCEQDGQFAVLLQAEGRQGLNGKFVEEQVEEENQSQGQPDEPEDDEGHESELRIVGPDEIDPARRYVSMDSPLGRALLGRREGDDITVERPKGRVTFTVIGIRYEDDASH